MNESHIVTRTYDLQLNGGKTVHLRLTVAAQLRLKNKFNEDALDVILSASSDPERLLAVLDEALHFNDDPNGDLTGERCMTRWWTAASAVWTHSPTFSSSWPMYPVC